jgi:predicted dehydrogenase
LLDLPSVVLYDGAKGQQTTTSFPYVEDDWAVGFRRSSKHFVDALVDGTPAEMSATDAIKALQLCFAVYQAANTRLPVDPRSITDSVVPEGWLS